MTTTGTEFKVLIIGGGNCGLAIATGLKKAGIHYTIFERDSEHDFQHRARDWGMLLHWGQEYLERVLPPHLKDRAREARVDPNHEMIEPVPYINGRTGEIVGKVPTPSINRVSRKKLRKLMTEGENLNIEFNKRLRSISLPDEKTVAVDFEDRTKASGNFVVGCDGSHSGVREFLVGPELAKLEDIPLTTINYAGAKYTAEEAQKLRDYHPIVKLSFHPDLPGAALLAALDTSSPDPSQWRFQNYSSWWGPPFAADLADPKARLDFYHNRMAQYCEPFRTAALAGTMADDTVLPIYAGHQWVPTMPWDNRGGRVSLAGDAAHSMLPHRGQGLNNAIADAALLVEAITSAVSGDQTLPQAIDKYEAEMKPRGANEVALSLQQAETSRDWNTLKESPIFKVGHSKQS